MKLRHYIWTEIFSDYEQTKSSHTSTLRVSYGAFILSSHYSDVMMGAMASQITSLTIVYSTVYSGANQRKRQSSASLAFVRGIHRWPLNSPHKWQITRKMFPFDDVIMFGEEILRNNESALYRVARCVVFCRFIVPMNPRSFPRTPVLKLIIAYLFDKKDINSGK